MSDFKDRVKSAIEKYMIKNSPSSLIDKPKKKKEKPEKEVERKVLEWCRAQGWSINVVESKSVWNEKAGRYISQSVIPGHSDLSGNTDLGQAVFIELKAPGRLGTIRPLQREFLLGKIGTGCFAVCVDSVDRLVSNWDKFSKAYNKKEFLVGILPKARVYQDRDLEFDDD